MTTYDEMLAEAKAKDDEEAANAEPVAEGEEAPPTHADSVIQPATYALAQAASAVLPAGTVPDDVLVGLVVEAIRGVDAVSYAGVVLDGFPKTLAQAHALEKVSSSTQQQAAANPSACQEAAPPRCPLPPL